MPLAPPRRRTAGKESLTTLAEKLDLKGQRVFVRVDFNGTRVCLGWCRFGRGRLVTAGASKGQGTYMHGVCVVWTRD